MAGLMQRMMLLFKAKFSKALDRAENPSETLDYSYERQVELLQNVKRGIADVVTAKKRLQLQSSQLEKGLVKLETQARQAISMNREDLARVALERKSGAQQELRSLDEQVAQLEDQQAQLVANEKALQAKIHAFRSQKEVMKAQYAAAEARVRVGEATTGIGGEFQDIGLAVERAREKTDQMTARADALEELTSSGALEDLTGSETHLDRELARLSSEAEVESELSKLKAELASGDPHKELTGGES
jgi:phage shock protein A